MRAIIYSIALVVFGASAAAQPVPASPPTSAIPAADELLQSGEIDGVYIDEVQIFSTSDRGPFTRFVITVPNHTGQYQFYVHNNDNTKAFERGGMVGLLMGVAETYRATYGGEYVQRQEHENSKANILYTTVQGRREIVAVSLNNKLQN